MSGADALSVGEAWIIRPGISEASSATVRYSCVKGEDLVAVSVGGAEARRRGIGKSTLHYLRKKARQHQRFRVYGKVRKKLIP
jgi:hypothetical protein